MQGTPVTIGAQDCHAEPSGAFTGDLSAEMLRDAGAVAVIVGHSERRMYHRETDTEVNAKARAAWRAGLTAIVCVGETKDERVGGKTLDVVHVQTQTSLPDGATAGKPGGGLRAGLGDRHRLDADARRRRGGAWLHPASISRRATARPGRQIRILYGGSVKPSNAGELMHVPNVDGALVGGASLKAEDFLGIARAYL